MMCGRSSVGCESVFGSHHHWGRRGGVFGLDTEKLNPATQMAVALSVLVPVGLSGVFLIAFMPGLWWIFTTYFWVAFPAVGLLASGVTGLDKERPVRVSQASRERELLEAIQESGEISAASAAAKTSLSVAEADRRLRELAENGHIEVRARGGAVLYALWTSGEG